MKSVILFVVIIAGSNARTTIRNNIRETGPACPIDDPFIKPAAPLNVTLPPLIIIDQGSSHGGYVSVGLSTLSYEYTVNLILLTVDFHVTLQSVETSCDEYSMTGWIDASPFRPETIPSGNFSGSGSCDILAEDLDVSGKATLFINLIGNKVTMRLLQIDTLTFDTLAFDLGPNFLVDGVPTNWDEFNANFKPNFLQDWANMKLEIVEKIRISINGFIGQFTLEELLELIGGDTGCQSPAP